MHIRIDICGRPISLGILSRGIYFTCADMRGRQIAKSACAADVVTGLAFVTNDGDLIVPADGEIVCRADGKVKQLGRWPIEYRSDGKIQKIGPDLCEYGQGAVPIRIGGCKRGATPPKEPEIILTSKGLPAMVGDFMYEYTNGKLTDLGGYPVRYRGDGKLSSIGFNVFRYSEDGFIIGTV